MGEYDKAGEEHLGSEQTWARQSHRGLAGFFNGGGRGRGQMKANVVGWPTFDGKFVNYPRFKKE
jgi:hypothetical protein